MKAIRTVCILFILTRSVFPASLDKIAKRIASGDHETAWATLCDKVPEAKNNYSNTKDTMRPKKQKSSADEYAALLLLKGYVGCKLNKPEAVTDLKVLTIFHDPYSTNQYLLRAHAWKLLATVNEAHGDQGQAEFCRKKSAEEYESFKALGEQSDTQNIIDGILGGLS